jgi:hypothetical protein
LSARYFRRGKIAAYRDQFMLGNGEMISGERFIDIKRLIDFMDARWYNADTNEEILDYTLIQELERKYQKNQ